MNSFRINRARPVTRKGFTITIDVIVQRGYYFLLYMVDITHEPILVNICYLSA